MKSTEEYLSILRSEKESLFRKYQISNLGLFGSVAHHEQREDSDIDIYYESSHMRTLVIYINITIFPLFMMSYRSKQTKITYLIFTKQRFFFAP